MSMKHSVEVPVFKLAFDDEIVERFKEGCAEILRSDALAEGQHVRGFEALFAKFIGVKHAIMVGSGTDALDVALRAVGIDGKDVVLPSNTFFATALAAKRAGARLVLTDIEDETFAIAPDDLERKIDERTGAVILIHIGGIISNYVKEIAGICERHGVPLIEDAAHAHGSRRNGLVAGVIGAIGCFSFFPTKVMTTGEGGMITTNDDNLAGTMRSLKNFGRDPSDSRLIVRCGYNCKVTEFQALLGQLEMERVGSRIERRRQLAERYQKNLAETSFEAVGFADGVNTYYKQIVCTDLPQEDLHHFCKRHGVGLTGEVYRIPVHRQPLFQEDFAYERFPVTEAFAVGHICPPLYPELDETDIDYVCEVLKLAQRELSP